MGVAAHKAAAAEDSIRVIMGEIAEIKLGGTVTRGDILTSDADGKAVAVTQHTHTENTAGSYTQNATTGAAATIRAIGMAMKSGVLDDLIPVKINPSPA